MMVNTRKALGPDKLMVANILRARFKDSGLEFMDYFDGSYIEGFQHAVGKMSKPDYIAKGIAALQKAALDSAVVDRRFTQRLEQTEKIILTRFLYEVDVLFGFNRPGSADTGAGMIPAASYV